MISNGDLIGLVKAKIADAEVDVLDKTGMRDRFIVHVTSRQFADMNLMDRHRLVQSSLTDAMKDGRVHAVEIKTAVPTDS